jgi:bifunctional UDP-N-acetylglucosamine pyrophosphorylase / glucosamine-1-phosphate N-acetyltransferase
MSDSELEEIIQKQKSLSSELDYKINEVAIILAAGHGKRIKSQKSKMLHSIWEVPTVERVFNACQKAIPNMNTVIVVGIKAADVMSVIGKRENTSFAFQAEQKGTGHAVQIGLEKIDSNSFKGIVYVFPGDMGLIDKDTVLMLKDKFVNSQANMMVLTGIYEGEVQENSYGRIIRVKDFDATGASSGADAGKVVEIMEHKDILSLKEDVPYEIIFNNRKYSYSKKELIENREFNSSVYAFDYQKLIELIDKLSSNNAQNEIYITDLIALFNQSGYTVGAVSPHEQSVVMGFNNKSVLREMEALARHKVYEKLKDIIEITDPEDFFIHESVVEQILDMDKNGIPLDIVIEKGAYIGADVKLNYNLTIKKNVFIDGNIIFGKNVTLSESVHLTCFPGQKAIIGDNVEILWGDIIKGNLEIGENSLIESSVNMTGSDEFPLRIGKNVLIKGTSYIFGSIIADDVNIEHSVIIKKRVDKLIKRNGAVQPIRFYLPMPAGIDAIEDL